MLSETTQLCCRASLNRRGPLSRLHDENGFSVVVPLRHKSPIVIIIMIVSRPQKVAEGHVRDARPVPPRYYVRGAEVNSLVDPDIDYIVSHI